MEYCIQTDSNCVQWRPMEPNGVNGVKWSKMELMESIGVQWSQMKSIDWNADEKIETRQGSSIELKLIKAFPKVNIPADGS